MLIDRKYIMDNRTSKGAWTKSQINALGIDWPPSLGWIKRLEGTQISEEMKLQFEAKKPAKEKKKTPEGLLQAALSNLQVISDEKLHRAVQIIQKELKARGL